METDMNRVYARIEERKEELFEILRELVRIDSQSLEDGTGREEGVARHLERVYREMGLEPDLFSPLDAGIEGMTDYYPGRHLENRYNCAAVVPGSDHGHRVMLAGHEDTVLIGDRAQWRHDPLGGELENGRLYGRGAGDDKAGIAIPIFVMRILKELGIVLPYDVVLAGYSDEENGGGNGALALCARYPCDEALNLDMTDMQVACSSSGGGVVEVTLVSDARCDSCSAVLDAFDVFRQELDVWAKERGDEFRRLPLYRDTDIPDTVARFQDVKAGFGGIEMGRLVTSITFYTTHDEETTRREWAEVERRFNGRAGALGVRIAGWRMATRFFRFAGSDPEARGARLLCRAVKECCGIDVKPSGVCLSDHPMFVRNGCPNALMTGCIRSFGVEGGAHQIDEYVETEQLVNCARTVAYFLLNCEF